MTAVAILLAAGRGERLGSAEPKAFAQVGGDTLLTRAVRAVERAGEVDGFVVASPPGREEEVRTQATSTKLLTVVAGGATRSASVRLALAAVPEDADVVVCHDVARTFADPALYARAIAALATHEGAVPVVAVTDTLKRVEEGEVLATVDREGLAAAQTPQAFRREALADAHARAEAEGWDATDDAGLLERAGYRVAAVEGDPGNVKITTPEDLARARERAGG